MNYIATIHGGEGPDVWDRDIEIWGETFMDAAEQATARAAGMYGQVYSLQLK